MPAGPDIAGFGYFIGVKAAGYCGAAKVLNRNYRNAVQPEPVWWKVGLTRTVIGIAFGAAYGAWWMFFAHAPRESSIFLYFTGLLPIRFLEWLILVMIFYDRRLAMKVADAKAIGGGTAWSYVLDAIGVGAVLVVPGGMWVC